MYRLLIVDDERHIVDWLYELFTELPDMELDIYKAYSGEDAIKTMNNIKMDIVLTDIRMPCMNGLELAEAVFVNWPGSKVIFLTGYNEFDYIYKAVKHEGVSYLLKTEDDEEIVNAVKRALDSIENSVRNKVLTDKARNKEDHLKYRLQREMLFNILNKGSMFLQADENITNTKVIGINIFKTVFLLLGHVGNIPVTAEHSEQIEIVQALELLTNEYLSHVVEFVIVNAGKSDFLWILQPKNNTVIKENADEALWKRSIMVAGEMLETLQTACKKTLDMEISFVFHGKPVLWHNAAELLEIMKEAVKGEIINKPGIPVIYCISDIGEQAAEHEDRNKQMINHIKAYIDRNICSELSLAYIAKHINYNPSYVSRLFKHVTGINLFDYISSIRMQKAMELLQTSNKNISDIAVSTGFGSSQYFATVFRKAKGLSPQEYREFFLKTSKQNEQM